MNCIEFGFNLLYVCIFFWGGIECLVTKSMKNLSTEHLLTLRSWRFSSFVMQTKLTSHSTEQTAFICENCFWISFQLSHFRTINFSIKKLIFIPSYFLGCFPILVGFVWIESISNRKKPESSKKNQKAIKFDAKCVCQIKSNLFIHFKIVVFFSHFWS